MSSHINPDSGTLIIESTNALDVTASPVDPVGAALHVKGGTYTEGNLYVGGTLLVNGDIISLGNGNASITINANVSSDVLPNVSSGIQYNLGSATNPWNVQYLQKLVTITTSVTNAASLNTSGISYIDGSTSTTLSLANGIEGETKTIVAIATPTGTIVITPDTFLNGTSISFTTVSQSATMIYTSAGWSITSSFGSPGIS
jgi:hypothetical protein